MTDFNKQFAMTWHIYFGFIQWCNS